MSEIWDIDGLDTRRKFFVFDIFLITFLAISIDRKDLVKTTFAEFSNIPLKDLRKKIKIFYMGEQGIDVGKLLLLLNINY